MGSIGANKSVATGKNPTELYEDYLSQFSKTNKNQKC